MERPVVRKGMVTRKGLKKANGAVARKAKQGSLGNKAG